MHHESNINQLKCVMIHIDFILLFNNIFLGSCRPRKVTWRATFSLQALSLTHMVYEVHKIISVVDGILHSS